MIKISKEQGLRFLNKIQQPHLSKEDIFNALFEVCGTGDDLNTKHVFFQEVIIKFNASKSAAVIANHLPHETESHFVDVALYAYIKSGFSMKQFDADLDYFKEKANFIYTPCANEPATFANA